MGVNDWNWRLPTDIQDYPWDCAAASTAWACRTIGYELSEQDVINGLGPERISATYGLLDASGAGLVAYLGEIGINASNNPNASWADVVAAAGYQPMVMGGRNWCHWVGVRMGGYAAGLGGGQPIILMNPAPGWMNIGQYMEEPDFNYLGSFSAVWFNSW
jgi:hypothetical protein